MSTLAELRAATVQGEHYQRILALINASSAPMTVYTIAGLLDEAMPHSRHQLLLKLLSLRNAGLICGEYRPLIGAKRCVWYFSRREEASA